MRLSSPTVLLIIIVLLIIGGAIFFAHTRSDTTGSLFKGEPEPQYEPNIIPEAFRPVVQNRFLSLREGEQLLYTGPVRRELTLTGETQQIMGVDTVVLDEKVYAADILKQDSKHFLAQDSEKNVWCFGQTISTTVGTTTSTHGSWMAGVDGAKPGIWMKDTPQVGESFPEEYYENGAMDMAEILSTSDTVDTPLGTYFGCIKVRRWSPLDTNMNTIRYYCPQIAKMVLEEGGGGKTVLTEVRAPTAETDSEESDAAE